MTSTYSKTGESKQRADIAGGGPEPGELLMPEERPSDAHVCEAAGVDPDTDAPLGKWVLGREGAKRTRNAAPEKNITVYGVEWQVDADSRENMRDAIDEAEYQNMPPEATQDWILADNTTRPTTAAELKDILHKYRMRKAGVYNAFNSWYAGDRAEKFSV